MTIVNDDQATLALSGVAAQDEGDSGTTTYTYTATLAADTPAGFTVDYQTQDGSATAADGDYLGGGGTLV